MELNVSDFDLLSFSPFRLNRLAAEVSVKLSSVYTGQFQISIIEWRILATLGAKGSCSAQRIVQSTRTHKSRISRGVSRLAEQGLVERLDAKNDRREVLLRLTRQGKKRYRDMVPVVLEQERQILSCLSGDELRSFHTVLNKLEGSLALTSPEDN